MRLITLTPSPFSTRFPKNFKFLSAQIVPARALDHNFA